VPSTRPKRRRPDETHIEPGRSRRLRSAAPESCPRCISDAGLRNHEEFFPGHVSTLALTDPELIEIFDNFAFDEVLSHGNLDVRTKLMVQLASIIASHGLQRERHPRRPRN
jgi:hypothetical protein